MADVEESEETSAGLLSSFLRGYCALRSREAAICGLKFFGVEKTLFASDMPFDPERGSAYIRWTIEIIDSLDINPAERRAIYEGDARKLLKLK